MELCRLMAVLCWVHVAGLRMGGCQLQEIRCEGKGKGLESNESRG